MEIKYNLLIIEKKQKELNGGIYKVDSWSATPFWLIFGSGEECNFVTYTYQYDKTEMRDIFKDKNGFSYLMIPLMKLDSNGVSEVYNALVEAWNNKGLRTSPEVVLAACYKIFPKYVLIDNKKFYVKKEEFDPVETKYYYVLQSRGRNSKKLKFENPQDIADLMKQNQDFYSIDNTELY